MEPKHQRRRATHAASTVDVNAFAQVIRAILILSAIYAVAQQRVITECSLTPNLAAGMFVLKPAATWLIFAGISAIGTIASDGLVTSLLHQGIGRVDYATLQITIWKTPNAKSNPTGIAVSNGSVDFSETGIGKIGVMPVRGGPITKLATSLPGASPDKMNDGPGGVCFSQHDLAKVAVINR